MSEEVKVAAPTESPVPSTPAPVTSEPAKTEETGATPEVQKPEKPVTQEDINKVKSVYDREVSRLQKEKAQREAEVRELREARLAALPPSEREVYLRSYYDQERAGYQQQLNDAQKELAVLKAAAEHNLSADDLRVAESPAELQHLIDLKKKERELEDKLAKKEARMKEDVEKERERIREEEREKLYEETGMHKTVQGTGSAIKTDDDKKLAELEARLKELRGANSLSGSAEALAISTAISQIKAKKK